MKTTPKTPLQEAMRLYRNRRGRVRMRAQRVGMEVIAFKRENELTERLRHDLDRIWEASVVIREQGNHALLRQVAEEQHHLDQASDLTIKINKQIGLT